MNKKIAAACIILAVMSGFACKEQQVVVEEKEGRCVNGNCRNGTGTYLYPNGNKYEGEFKSGMPFGYGTMYYKNGIILKGKWKWGKPDLR